MVSMEGSLSAQGTVILLNYGFLDIKVFDLYAVYSSAKISMIAPIQYQLFRQSFLADLLQDTGHAHHAAFTATDGADPDWSIWYADNLKEPFAQRFDMNFHRSQLIYCLIDADYEHQARSPDSNWPEFYAAEIIERYAPSESPDEDKLALYHFNGCPFCAIARSAIDRLGIEVELRDIHENPQHRDDLIAARGRATVPVLRITAPDGEDRWMPESRDIANYLEMTFA